MSSPPMPRPSLHTSVPSPRWLLTALALGLASFVVWPQRASAQITWSYSEYGDRGLPGTDPTSYLVTFPLSLAECMSSEPIRITVNNAPFDSTGVTVRQWDLWQGGTETGANCQTAATRKDPSGGNTSATRVCDQRTWSGASAVTSTMMTLSFLPGELFPDCSSEGTLTFYVLAMSARGDFTTDIAATAYFMFRVRLDVTPPTAPTLSDAAGDRQIRLGWTNTTAETLRRANVYVDNTTSCDETSTLLVGGATAPSTLLFGTTEGASPTSLTIDGASLGIATNGSVRAAVTVVDRAGNESVLSNVACIRRVPVAGFWDEYCAQEGMSDVSLCTQHYSGCSAMPGRRSDAAWWMFLALGALGVSVRARRRGGVR